MNTRAIKFEDSQWTALTKIAKQQGLTTAGLIRQVLFNFINSQKKSTK